MDIKLRKAKELLGKGIKVHIDDIEKITLLSELLAFSFSIGNTDDVTNTILTIYSLGRARNESLERMQ